MRYILNNFLSWICTYKFYFELGSKYFLPGPVLQTFTSLLLTYPHFSSSIIPFSVVMKLTQLLDSSKHSEIDPVIIALYRSFESAYQSLLLKNLPWNCSEHGEHRSLDGVSRSLSLLDSQSFLLSVTLAEWLNRQLEDGHAILSGIE